MQDVPLEPWVLSRLAALLVLVIALWRAYAWYRVFQITVGDLKLAWTVLIVGFALCTLVPLGSFDTGEVVLAGGTWTAPGGGGGEHGFPVSLGGDTWELGGPNLLVFYGIVLVVCWFPHDRWRFGPRRVLGLVALVGLALWTATVPAHRLVTVSGCVVLEGSRGEALLEHVRARDLPPEVWLPRPVYEALAATTPPPGLLPLAEVRQELRLEPRSTQPDMPYLLRTSVVTTESRRRIEQQMAVLLGQYAAYLEVLALSEELARAEPEERPELLEQYVDLRRDIEQTPPEACPAAWLLQLLPPEAPPRFR